MNVYYPISNRNVLKKIHTTSPYGFKNINYYPNTSKNKSNFVNINYTSNSNNLINIKNKSISKPQTAKQKNRNLENISLNFQNKLFINYKSQRDLSSSEIYIKKHKHKNKFINNKSLNIKKQTKKNKSNTNSKIDLNEINNYKNNVEMKKNNNYSNNINNNSNYIEIIKEKDKEISNLKNQLNSIKNFLKVNNIIYNNSNNIKNNLIMNNLKSTKRKYIENYKIKNSFEHKNNSLFEDQFKSNNNCSSIKKIKYFSPKKKNNIKNKSLSKLNNYSIDFTSNNNYKVNVNINYNTKSYNSFNKITELINFKNENENDYKLKLDDIKNKTKILLNKIEKEFFKN